MFNYTKKAKGNRNKETHEIYHLNINRYAISKDDYGRNIQLAVFFYLIKQKFGKDAYYEFISKDGKETFSIPFSFNVYEIIMYVKKYGFTDFYIEFNKVSYIKIMFDDVEISGDQKIYDIVKDLLKTAEGWSTDFAVYTIDMTQHAEWLWTRFYNNEYDIAITIGNKHIGAGSLTVYPEEFDDIIIASKDEYDNLLKYRIEYVIVRSFLNDAQVLIFDNIRRKILCIGFDELQKTDISDIISENIAVGV